MSKRTSMDCNYCYFSASAPQQLTQARNQPGNSAFVTLLQLLVLRTGDLRQVRDLMPRPLLFYLANLGRFEKRKMTYPCRTEIRVGPHPLFSRFSYTLGVPGALVVRGSYG
eukprot:gnl/MRDRNA2_/MRDRNA2_64830_c0_seq1.p2 gnl/MRDRNA2_/MRDRNA2_64830_c0~~gnl/MRDRNA2_/MRDRNA2_64830_c0_seq1.p2  ORF type:complete len:111 (+),score=2.60 gnl/MRDRNA2_/MRDRNA2_64830_c0_seq1:53-385(+)